jgi:aldose 1-epimerase
MALTTVTLHDPQTSAEAEIVVELGFNCDRFVTHVNGQQVDVIWSVRGFTDGGHRAAGSGIPLLFPFPGRIQGAQFEWQGTCYSLPEGDGRGNAIHGFVHERPWRVLSRSDQHVTGRFQASVDDADLLTNWPSDFGITATYRLSGHCLALHLEIDNPGDRPLPCGLGAHPYFRLPLTGAGEAERCRVVLPVSRRWALQEMIATGEQFELPDAERMQRGFELDGAQFDHVFTGLVPRDGRYVARIEDPASRLATQVEFAAPFRECVVYTPDHREAICIEPYTCVPDAARLQAAGVDAGLRVLKPGERLAAEIRILVTIQRTKANRDIQQELTETAE